MKGTKATIYQMLEAVERQLPIPGERLENVPQRLIQAIYGLVATITEQQHQIERLEIQLRGEHEGD